MLRFCCKEGNCSCIVKILFFVNKTKNIENSMFYRKILFNFFYFKISHFIQCVTCHLFVIKSEIYKQFLFQGGNNTGIIITQGTVKHLNTVLSVCVQ